MFTDCFKTYTVSLRSYYPLVNVYKKLLKMAIEIVNLPIKNGDFPVSFLLNYQRVNPSIS